MKLLEKNLFNKGIKFNLLLRLLTSKPHQQQLISFLHCRKTEKIFSNVCVFVHYPPQFLDRSRVGLLLHTVPYQSKNPGPPLACWWTIALSLSTLTSSGGRENFAPACFSSACIRCALKTSPV
ncbi:hypothetical protein CRENBAI_004155 [Crenichthys baileyi]|uniref:Uncharacterized protein n=1 Tax=Crenichthys baileyi TaxID=28760 RepID=A0AAV9S8M5_9TELE